MINIPVSHKTRDMIIKKMEGLNREQLREVLKAGEKLLRIREKLMGPLEKETPDEDEISACPKCYCMTHTIKGKCGKCGAEKDEHSEKRSLEK